MYMTTWLGIFVMSLPGMDMVDWKEMNGRIDWSAILICGAATALATVVANLGTGAWLSGILANLFLEPGRRYGTAGVAAGYQHHDDGRPLSHAPGCFAGRSVPACRWCFGAGSGLESYRSLPACVHVHQHAALGSY